MLDRKIRRLLREIAEPVYWQGHLLRVAPVFGVAYADGETGRDAERLFSAALTEATEARLRLRRIGRRQAVTSLI